MKTATAKEIKTELSYRSSDELMALCLRLSRFKKENKELLTYLLFESSDEEHYRTCVQENIKEEFRSINTDSYYYIKKSVRKILRNTKKYIRYSGNKETEVSLLLYFCGELKKMKPSIRYNTVLQNLMQRELIAVKKKIALLHEDLQYDYHQELEALL